MSKALTETEAKQLLEAELLANVQNHSCVNNAFFDTWTRRTMTPSQYMDFTVNHGFWIKSFPDNLAALFLSTPDIRAKQEIAETLASEMGRGKPEKAHSQLFLQFGKALADTMGWRETWDREISRLANAPRDGSTMLPSTKALVEGEKALYTDPDPRIGVGAQLALEWQAFTMMGKLYEVAKPYSKQFRKEAGNNDAFYENAEFYYAHMIDEKDHKVESLNAALQYIHTKEDFDKVKEGFERHLEVIADHWQGLHQQLTRARSFKPAESAVEAKRSL